MTLSLISFLLKWHHATFNYNCNYGCFVVFDCSPYQREQNKEPRDVSDHPSERDLQSTKDFEGGHEVRRTGDAQYVGHGEEYVRNDLRVVWPPFKPC